MTRAGERPTVLLNCIKMHEGASRALHGNFSHIQQLYNELIKNQNFNFTVHVDAVTLPIMRASIPEERLHVTQAPVDSIVQQDCEIVKAVRRVRPDIYHKPTGQLPLIPLSCKCISGIADLIHLHAPMSWTKTLYKQMSYQLSVFYADCVICTSHATRNEVIQRLRVKPEKVRVVYHGSTRMTETPREVALPRMPFFVTFGHQRHKNVEACIKALAIATHREKVQARLVVVGVCPGRAALERLAASEGVSELVSMVGRVSNGELRFLYRHAIALLFLSKYEGFGLPILEAMVEGCPVIASNVYSIPEVVGQAGLLFAVDDYEGVAAAMIKIAADPSLRGELVVKGYNNAERFSWRTAADQVAEIYKELLHS